MKAIGSPICLTKNTLPNEDAKDVRRGSTKSGEDDLYLPVDPKKLTSGHFSGSGWSKKMWRQLIQKMSSGEYKIVFLLLETLQNRRRDASVPCIFPIISRVGSIFPPTSLSRRYSLLSNYAVVVCTVEFRRLLKGPLGHRPLSQAKHPSCCGLRYIPSTSRSGELRKAYPYGEKRRWGPHRT